MHARWSYRWRLGSLTVVVGLRSMCDLNCSSAITSPCLLILVLNTLNSKKRHAHNYLTMNHCNQYSCILFFVCDNFSAIFVMRMKVKVRWKPRTTATTRCARCLTRSTRSSVSCSWPPTMRRNGMLMTWLSWRNHRWGNISGAVVGQNRPNLRVYALTNKNYHLRTLKILWSMSELGGFRKHEKTQCTLYWQKEKNYVLLYSKFKQQGSVSWFAH